MLEGVFDSLKPLLRSLCAIICERIYPVIGYTYDLFIKVAEYRLIDSSAENNPIREIYYRITLILSIVMVFYITFELVKYLVQPDTISDKQKGIQHVPLKLISIILLIAFIPNIFELSGKLESAVITNE